MTTYNLCVYTNTLTLEAHPHKSRGGKIKINKWPSFSAGEPAAISIF